MIQRHGQEETAAMQVSWRTAWPLSDPSVKAMEGIAIDGIEAPATGEICGKAQHML